MEKTIFVTAAEFKSNGGVLELGRMLFNSKGSQCGKLVSLTGGILEKKEKYITYKQFNGAEVFQEPSYVYVEIPCIPQYI